MDTPALPRASLLKIPRQQRSIGMVQNILDAAVIVLQRDGVAAFNTNRLAEVAGVSVGSIYQYFANREMIIAGVIERGVVDTETRMRSAATLAAGEDIVEAMRLLLTDVLVSLEPYRGLLYEVLSATPVLSGTGLAATLETRFSDAARDFFVSYADRYMLRGGVPALYVTVNGLVYVSLKWLSERPAHITREQLVEVCIDQFQNLVSERAA